MSERMPKRVLITGGAGFIGSHLADELIERGYCVRALDNFCSQVHGPDASWPSYLNPEVELMIGDVQDPEAVAKAYRYRRGDIRHCYADRWLLGTQEGVALRSLMRESS